MTTKSNPARPVPMGMGRCGRAAGAAPVIDREGGRDKRQTVRRPEELSC